MRVVRKLKLKIWQSSYKKTMQSPTRSSWLSKLLAAALGMHGALVFSHPKDADGAGLRPVPFHRARGWRAGGCTQPGWRPGHASITASEREDAGPHTSSEQDRSPPTDWFWPLLDHQRQSLSQLSQLCWPACIVTWCKLHCVPEPDFPSKHIRMACSQVTSNFYCLLQTRFHAGLWTVCWGY